MKTWRVYKRCSKTVKLLKIKHWMFIVFKFQIYDGSFSFVQCEMSKNRFQLSITFLIFKISKKIDFWFLVFNAIFINISTILSPPVLVVEEARDPERTIDHGQATGKLYHLRLRVECTLFCNLQSRVQTHAVLVIVLYELLGNPTT